MKIKLSELGRHEAYLRLNVILKAGDKHIQLERKLTSELIRNWRESYDDALKELFRRLPEGLTSQAVEIITQGLANALGYSFGNSQKVRDELRKYISRAYHGGKSEFAVNPSFTLKDVRAIEILTRHNCYWLGEHYGKHVGGKIARLTQEAISDGLGRNELAESLRQELGGIAGGYKYWDVASSAALVRSRSFGCVAGMVDAGIMEYEILAMGDERMCDICGEMHGRTFSVSEAQKVIDSVLDINNPDKFKTAMPWHISPSVGVSSSKLLADGMSITPFHGRCRCVLVVAEINDSEPVFPNLKPEEVISYDKDTRIARIKAHNVPRTGLPHWKYNKLNKSDQTVQRRFFDGTGKPKLDIDFNDYSKPKAHPMGAHSHDYIDGERGDPRALKNWERNMMTEIQNQEAQNIVKGKVQMISGCLVEIGDEHITVEEYKRIMDIGGKYGFIYDGRGYFTSGFGHPEAWEWNNDDSYMDGFKDIDDMLDNYRVHTGKTLREIIPKSILEESPV